MLPIMVSSGNPHAQFGIWQDNYAISFGPKLLPITYVLPDDLCPAVGKVLQKCNRYQGGRESISFFYDPATKNLRKRFEKYPDAIQTGADFFHSMEKAQTELLMQVRAERQKH